MDTKIIASKKTTLHEFISWFFINACFSTVEDFDTGYASTLACTISNEYWSTQELHKYITEHWNNEVIVQTTEGKNSDYLLIVVLADRNISFDSQEIYEG